MENYTEPKYEVGESVWIDGKQGEITARQGGWFGRIQGYFIKFEDGTARWFGEGVLDAYRAALAAPEPAEAWYAATTPAPESGDEPHCPKCGDVPYRIGSAWRCPECDYTWFPGDDPQPPAPAPDPAAEIARLTKLAAAFENGMGRIAMDADKDIRELRAVIARLTAERDTARSKVTRLVESALVVQEQRDEFREALHAMTDNWNAALIERDEALGEAARLRPDPLIGRTVKCGSTGEIGVVVATDIEMGIYFVRVDWYEYHPLDRDEFGIWEDDPQGAPHDAQ